MRLLFRDVQPGTVMWGAGSDSNDNVIHTFCEKVIAKDVDNEVVVGSLGPIWDIAHEHGKWFSSEEEAIECCRSETHKRLLLSAAALRERANKCEARAAEIDNWVVRRQRTPALPPEDLE